jgi:hypothetical protein
MMKKMLCSILCCMLISLGAKAQSDIQGLTFFGILADVEFLQDPYIPLLDDQQKLVTQADFNKQSIQSDLDKMLSRIIPTGRLEGLHVQNYEWLQFAETNQLETLYESEFKIGFSKPLAAVQNTEYQLGFAMIRPAVNSIAWNASSNSAVDAIDKRSSFISFSIQSKF